MRLGHRHVFCSKTAMMGSSSPFLPSRVQRLATPRALTVVAALASFLFGVFAALVIPG